VSQPYLFIDFSNIARACWHPAEHAEESGKKALQAHLAACPVWAKMVAEGNDVTDCCVDLPTQYDAHEVLKTNLRGKMGTIEENTGVPRGPHWVWAVDTYCKWRRDAFPAYKGNRDPSKFDPRPEAHRYLAQAFPEMHWAVSLGAEADDVIAALVAKRGDREVVIVSGDQDLWQLIQPGVKVFLPSKKVFVTPEMVEDEYDLEPKRIPLYKAFWGDSSDNMPNLLPRQQKAILPHIRASDGTPGDVLLRLLADPKTSPKLKAALTEQKQGVAINHYLAQLDPTVKVIFDSVNFDIVG
jgi:hypothetical protein